jgi:hypothetical protein
MGTSPTFNANQGLTGQYPSLEGIMDLVRSLVNDSMAGLTGTPGEGQIITDNPAISPFTQPFLNSAIREVYRELRNVGQPTLIKDNYLLLGIPVFVSPTQGPGGVDPSLQCFIGFNGYFNGTSINPLFTLPNDMLYPVKLWERTNGSNDYFFPMRQPTFGLPSRYQAISFIDWEWREDAIWLLGATTVRDVRMRYYAAFPQFFSEDLDFTTTFVPIMDSLDAIAYKCAVKYATMLGSPGLEELRLDAKDAMFQLKNANTRRMQSMDFERQPYTHYGRNDGIASTDGLEAFGQ